MVALKYIRIKGCIMNGAGVSKSIVDALPASITIGQKAKSVMIACIALTAITFAAPHVGFGLVAAFVLFKLGCARKGLL